MSRKMVLSVGWRLPFLPAEFDALNLSYSSDEYDGQFFVLHQNTHPMNLCGRSEFSSRHVKIFPAVPEDPATYF